MKENKLRAEFVNNLKQHSNIVRIIGEAEEVYNFTLKEVSEDATYIRAEHDKEFYSFNFVESFTEGGVVVFDTTNRPLAEKLLAVVQDKSLNLGGCEVEMSDRFFAVLCFHGEDDLFLHGRLYQL